jgi:DNA-binding NtrC family response regulator
MREIRPRLLRIEGGVIQAEFPLEDGTVAGRAPSASVRLLDQSVSREHARFYRAGSDWWMRDLGSRNGSRINGAPIEAEILKPGDEIRLGQVTLVFSDPGAEPRETVVLTGEAAAPDAGAEDPGERVSEATDPLDLERLVDRFLTRALRAGRCARAALLLRAPGSPGFGIREARDAAGGEPREFEIDAELVAEVVDRGAAQADQGTVVVPLAAGDRAFGALVAQHDPGGAFDAGAIDKVQQLCAAAAESLLAALRVSRSEAQLEVARADAQAGQEFIGTCGEVLRVLETVDRVAPTHATVLIEGETGTGKELIARRIHERSTRAHGPFVAVNCAAVAPSLFESELFGHERGAFTGATRAKPGRLELASGGTLFLDEVSELPREAQAKLLRALQERVIERVGGTKSISIDARFVAATNRDLKQEVGAGRFRRDLYYRLTVVTIRLPALRERRDDVPLLADHFLKVFSRRLGKEIEGFDAQALKVLQQSRWPGNVRELANVVHRAAVLAEGRRVRHRDLGIDRLDGALDDSADQDAYDLETVEKRAVARALRRTGWKKGETAKLLGISFPTLNKKIRKYGLQPDE